MSLRLDDVPELRKARGAFFTPPAIADFLAAWAVDKDPDARVLDPTCGEAVFLLAAGRELKRRGCPTAALDEHLFGVDLHEQSLSDATSILEGESLDAKLLKEDFFEVPTPDQLGCPLPRLDAVVGNPPFVRYQDHTGTTRKRSQQAALRQGVRLSGLASSWAALLVHSCGFLKPEGRLAMVLPAELLTVHYAEAVRRWLKQRFAAVHLVLFEELQFEDALEKVVLVVAKGSGGCDSFSLHYVNDAEDLLNLGPFDHYSVTPADEGKWTDMLLPLKTRQLFKRVVGEHFTPLGDYGSPELGSVTGANSFFTLNEETRQEYGLAEDQLARISPPGTRHLKGFSFTGADWKELRARNEPVWLLRPDPKDRSEALLSYIEEGQRRGVPDAYKCRVREQWWRPRMVTPPDLFFTYMSHRYPRLVTNSARCSFVNSMHGIRLRSTAPKSAKQALPLLALNSISMLGAEVHGRSYGGGILKMEPREASVLPVPSYQALLKAWEQLRPEKPSLERKLRNGLWTNVAKRVDAVLLRDVMGLAAADVDELYEAAGWLRERRLG